jgi:beta-lactamase class A
LAQSLWQEAVRHGDQAYALGDPTTLPDEQVAVAYAQWQQALYTLSQVPPTSFVAPAAATQAALYRQQLATLAYRYDTLRSEFLFPIADQGGDASRVRITVCNLRRECRRWQGNRPPANPASLIKVPVAVALMTKLHQEGVDPQAGLWVNPSNWTEDAGWIRVRSEYALERVMADMISRSGNVATNQLIDYLGWEGVNQALQAQGYTATRITTKLVGDKTYPANRGFAPNQLTTDELTDMMVGIYNQEHPNSAAIQAALANQVDIRLGKTALRPPMIWLGEKTGRNSQVIGSTMAALIGGETYIITATLDHSGNEAALRTVMAGVAEHILTHHGFDPMGAALPTDHPHLTAPSRAFLP